MTSKKTTPPQEEPISREEAEQLFIDIVEADKKDKELTKLLIDVKTYSAQKLLKLRLFADQNPNLFKNKIAQFSTGVMGFRKGELTVRMLHGWTWDKVIGCMKQLLPNMIHVVEEPDKDKIIAMRQFPEIYMKYPKVGIEVVEEDEFFTEWATAKEEK